MTARVFFIVEMFRLAFAFGAPRHSFLLSFDYFLLKQRARFFQSRNIQSSFALAQDDKKKTRQISRRHFFGMARAGLLFLK